MDKFPPKLLQEKAGNHNNTYFLNRFYPRNTNFTHPLVAWSHVIAPLGLTFVLLVEMVDTLAPGDLVTCAI